MNVASGNRRTARTIAGVILLGALLCGVELGRTRYAGAEPSMSPQSRINLLFAQRPTLSAALEGYPKVRPPLYPTLLWSFGRSGLPLAWLNIAVFYVGLGALWFAARRVAPERNPLYLVSFYAVGQFHYAIVYQYVSESLLVVLALGAFLAGTPAAGALSLGRALFVGGLVAAACLTRTFSLFWLVPSFALVGLPLSGGRPVAKLKRVGAFLAVALGPSAVWMAYTYRATGHLTGRDRFVPRRTHALTDFEHNLWFTFKTYAVDFLSPAGRASHKLINARWTPSAVEFLLLSVIVAAAIGTLLVFIRSRGEPRRPDPLNTHLICLTLGYAAWIVLLWTIGNNDPIYSRFLYPSYAFVALLAWAGYAHARQTAWLRHAYHAACLGVVAVQLYRTFLIRAAS
jgi:hypothetical protein